MVSVENEAGFIMFRWRINGEEFAMVIEALAAKTTELVAEKMGLYSFQRFQKKRAQAFFEGFLKGQAAGQSQDEMLKMLDRILENTSKSEALYLSLIHI